MAEDKGDDSGNVEGSGRDFLRTVHSKSKALGARIFDKHTFEEAKKDNNKTKKEELEAILRNIRSLASRASTPAEFKALRAQISWVRSAASFISDFSMEDISDVESEVQKNEKRESFLHPELFDSTRISLHEMQFQKDLEAEEARFNDLIERSIIARKDYTTRVDDYYGSVDFSFIEDVKKRIEGNSKLLLSEEEIERLRYSQEEIKQRRELQASKERFEKSYLDISNEAIAHYELLEKLEKRRDDLVALENGVTSSNSSRLQENETGRSRKSDRIALRRARVGTDEQIKAVSAERIQIENQIRNTEKRIERLEEEHKAFDVELEKRKPKIEKFRNADKSRAEILAHQAEIYREHVKDAVEQKAELESKKDKMVEGGFAAEEVAIVDSKIIAATHEVAKKTELAKKVKVESQKASEEGKRFSEAESSEMKLKKARLKALSAARKKKKLSVGASELVKEKSREITRDVVGVKLEDEKSKDKYGTLKPDFSIGKKPNPDKTRPR